MSKNKSLEEITLPRLEYEILKIFEKDAKEIMKFLAINHHNIYMEIISNKLVEVERRFELLNEVKKNE